MRLKIFVHHICGNGDPKIMHSLSSCTKTIIRAGAQVKGLLKEKRPSKTEV